MKRHDITLSGRRVRYYETGYGTPLLFVHGAGGTGRIWAGLMRALSRDFRCIAPDLPGFGGSEFYDGCAGPEGYASFLAGLIAGLGIERPDLAGCSLGGRAACMLAARHPELVGRLFLIAPSGAGYLPQDRLDGLIGKAYEGAQEASEMERAAFTIGELRRLGGLGALGEDVLKSVTAQTVIIWGEDDDVLPPTHAEFFSKAILESRVVTLNGAGHLPWLDKQDKVANIILKFKIN